MGAQGDEIRPGDTKRGRRSRAALRHIAELMRCVLCILQNMLKTVGNGNAKNPYKHVLGARKEDDAVSLSSLW